MNTPIVTETEPIVTPPLVASLHLSNQSPRPVVAERDAMAANDGPFAHLALLPDFTTGANAGLR